MAHESIDRLRSIGIDYDDACALRRISMTLHRWHELECGDCNGAYSYCVARGHKKNGAFEYADDGAAYLEMHSHNANGATYRKIEDRERGALKRLAKIMAKYPTLTPYVQGDPRGASLYVLRPDDVRGPIDSCYSNGIAVYR